MLGAILGDIIGSPYEFDDNNIKTTEFPLFSANSTFTDDSVMTLAVAEALLDTLGQEDGAVLSAVTERMRHYGRAYPWAGYGGRFRWWLSAREPEPYNSYGNGSAMRVSAAGWLFDSLEATLHAARLTALPTHNHPEGIKGAEATAAVIYLARTGESKAAIKKYIEETFGYDLDTPLDVIRPAYHMDESCQGTVPQALRAFLEGEDYESAVRLAVSIGGDSDTLACITGGVAEAAWGLPDNLQAEALARLPEDLAAVARRFLEKVKG